MALGQMGGKQEEMFITWDELPRSPGHPFYERLQNLKKELDQAGFDRFAEEKCAPYYVKGRRGRPSVPPGRYFRMHFVGYFRGDRQRAIEWKYCDSLALREFLKLKLVGSGYRTIQR
ncbi:MAG: transposase [Magnetococcales bacterium]|nr:transposase [Magnetococcales bacterium]